MKAGSASVVRTALIGFGRVAELHYVPALRALPNVRIVAVADPLVARQEAAREAFGDATIFPRADILLATEALDAVLIASPAATHFAIVEAAVQREVAVFVEKPFVGPGEVALLKRVSRTDRLMIDFNRRFWPGYQHLRTLVANSRRTDPIWMRVVMQVDSQRWNSITRISERGGEGGVLYDLGSHAIDLALFISGGEPISVRARSTTPTACSLKVRLRDGSTAACFVRYDRRAVERIEVRSTVDSYRSIHPMMSLRAGIHRVRSAAAAARDCKALAAHLSAGRRSMVRFTIAAALEHFFTSLPEGISAMPGFAVGLQNAVCLEAALKSIAQRRTVALDEIATTS
ncbi:MAG: Gfo/Idh/MocA family protein [Chthoniobacterales bacterium]